MALLAAEALGQKVLGGSGRLVKVGLVAAKRLIVLVKFEGAGAILSRFQEPEISPSEGQAL
jgi:hypothetical protein